jgi:HD-GYP domain-containing protein (c-di-GMP phosphodiesterase class II)
VSFQREFALLTRKAYVTAELQQRAKALALRNDVADDIDGFLGQQGDHFTSELKRQLSSEQRLITLALTAEATVDEDVFHPWRVQRLLILLGTRLQLSAREIAAIALGGLLHDIGMISVPRSTQLKTEQLERPEIDFIRSHPFEGTRLLAGAEVADALIVEEVIRGHHERYDGAGYPDGLRGEAIFIGARMCALADSFDVMTHDRPYATAKTIEEALAEIERQLGRQFDPIIGRIFIDMVRELVDKYVDLDAHLTAAVASNPIAKAAMLAKRQSQLLLQ